jgi:hypothetical protein
MQNDLYLRRSNLKYFAFERLFQKMPTTGLSLLLSMRKCGSGGVVRQLTHNFENIVLGKAQVWLW